MTNAKALRTNTRFGKPMIAALACLGALTTSDPAEAKLFKTVTTLAEVPADPGYPEGIAVDGSRMYVSTPARFGTAGAGPSQILVYHTHSGALIHTIDVDGEDLAAEHALSGLAIDGDHRIYALSTQLGVIRFEKHWFWGYSQEVYAPPLPDLPSCLAAAPGEACSPTLDDAPPLPNDIVFDDGGNAYVTDSMQATIFKIPPGGEPEIWFQSAYLAPPEPPLNIGTNGVRLSPDRTKLYFVVSFSAVNFPNGVIYELPLVDAPTEADLSEFHTYTAGEAPDGMAFGASGRLYVALAGANAISVLAPDGTEEARITTPASADVPFDAPASVAFDSVKKSLVVTNHALFSGDPEHFAVLRVFVGEKGDPLDRPELP